MFQDTKLPVAVARVRVRGALRLSVCANHTVAVAVPDCGSTTASSAVRAQQRHVHTCTCLARALVGRARQKPKGRSQPADRTPRGGTRVPGDVSVAAARVPAQPPGSTLLTFTFGNWRAIMFVFASKTLYVFTFEPPEVGAGKGGAAICRVFCTRGGAGDHIRENKPIGNPRRKTAVN